MYDRLPQPDPSWSSAAAPASHPGPRPLAQVEATDLGPRMLGRLHAPPAHVPFLPTRGPSSCPSPTAPSTSGAARRCGTGWTSRRGDRGGPGPAARRPARDLVERGGRRRPPWWSAQQTRIEAARPGWTRDYRSPRPRRDRPAHRAVPLRRDVGDGGGSASWTGRCTSAGCAPSPTTTRSSTWTASSARSGRSLLAAFPGGRIVEPCVTRLWVLHK
jgi:hypothetical protein